MATAQEDPEKLRLRPGDAELAPDRFLRLSLFQGLPQSAQARLRGQLGQGAVVLRRYRADEIICRQGEPGWTAFYLLRQEDRAALGEAPLTEAADQRVEVLLTHPDALPAGPGPAQRPAGVRGVLAGLFGSRRRAGAEPAAQRVALLGEGEVFGEMSCMHRAPRTATLRAAGACVAIEFLANVLEILLRSERFRAEMDARYRARALSRLLRAIPLFAGLPDEAIELLRRRADLITRRPGEVLFHHGDPSDSLYVIRSGTVKILRPDGHVLGYRSQGEVIGERGLITGAPRSATCAAYEHPQKGRPDREQLALRVELVRIDRALFEELCALTPALQAEVTRRAQAGGRDEAGDAAATATSRFTSLGLAQGRRLMLIDLERCTFCGDCVRACGDAHGDGLPRLSLEGPRIGRYLVSRSCRDCADPVCLIGCPVGAIHRGRSGEIVIESWCIGCGLCAARCPYEAIEMEMYGGDRSRAVTCDHCAGLRHAPRCVHACPHEAALRVDGNRFFKRMQVG